MQSLNLKDVINALAKLPEERNCRKMFHELIFLEQGLELRSAKDCYCNFGDLDFAVHELLKFWRCIKRHKDPLSSAKIHTVIKGFGAL